MSNERPIIAVRFHTSVNLPNETNEWFESRPAYGMRSEQIRVRVGNPDLGEQRSSLIFEIRKGGENGDVDIEVPASNLAMVQRKPPETKPTQQAKR